MALEYTKETSSVKSNGKMKVVPLPEDQPMLSFSKHFVKNEIMPRTNTE